MHDIAKKFGDLLYNEESLHYLLFPEEIVEDFLLAVDDRLGDSPEEPDSEVVQEAFEKEMDRQLSLIVNEEMTAELVLMLVHALR